MQSKPHFKRILLGVVLILCIPVIGMLLSDEWQWGPMDFIIMGTLLFITGLGIDYSLRKFTTPVSKIFGVLVALGIFLAIWVELAVDGVSQLITFLLG